ncbi:DoxX family protein [Compostibacter hankyongensis]|uniref:DoxX family protein n=1 Tax=Compostibacter hankyongensis TaxID=1007089 RepID=A0ABP8G2K2_9BACT
MKLLSTKVNTGMVHFSLLLLRVGLGLMMMVHGWQKLQRFSEMAAQFADPLHVGTRGSLVLVLFSELGCAFLVMLGLLTRFAALVLLIQLCIVVLIIHRGDFGHQELGLHFLLGYLVILLCGPGRISVDRLIAR